MSNISYSVVIGKIKSALSLFVDNDSSLTSGNMHELTISNQLAFYLKKEFADFHVDIEWDKNTVYNDPALKKKLSTKFVNNMRGAIKKQKTQLIQEKYNSRSIQSLINLFVNENHEIRPDIIVHERHSLENNIAVIEIKKSKGISANKKYGNKKLYDLLKLYHLTSDPAFGYKYGFFIEFPKTTSYETINIKKSDFINTLINDKSHNVYEFYFE